MSSQRRLNVIRISCGEGQEKQAERFIAILEKFKQTMKTLDVFVKCSWENGFALLRAASDVERLKLNLSNDSETPKRRRVELQEFGKVTSLEFHRCPGAETFFNAIRDGVLENLTIIGARNEISDAVLQNFLAQQCNLTVLMIESDISDAIFRSVCQLRKLEKLTVSLAWYGDKSCIEDLSNLENLVELKLSDLHRHGGVWPGSQFLSGVVLPNLLELELNIERLDPQVFTNMGAGMASLQQLKIDEVTIASLPQIIDSFQELTSLELWDLWMQDIILVPPRRNESLQHLKLVLRGSEESTYDFIAACPNLETLILKAGGGVTSEMVACVRQLPHLTFFSFMDHRREDDIDRMLDKSLGPALVEIINHLLVSPSLVELELIGIPGVAQQFVEDCFEDDFDRIDIALTRPGTSEFNKLIIKKK